jgi:AcrR family transcriptional regulator
MESMAQTRRGPGRPRSAEADAAILDAALEELIQRGIAATSIEQVAQRAGVTRATIYRRFPGKVELLSAAIEAAYGNPPATPEIRDVEHLLTGWAHVLSQPRQRRLLRRLYSSIDDYPELQQAHQRSLQQPREQARRDVLERAHRRGQFPPDADVDVILQVLIGAVWHHLAAYPDTSGARDVKRYLTAVLRQTGYRPDGDPA